MDTAHLTATTVLPADCAEMLRSNPALARHAALIAREFGRMTRNLAELAATLPSVLSDVPLESAVQELVETRNVLFALKASLDDELLASYERLGVAMNRRDEARCGADAPLDWAWLLTGDGISQVAYRKRQAALQERGLSASGVFEDTRQAVVQVALSRDEAGQSNLEQTLRGLAEVLPFVLPRKDGCRWLKVSEYTCSASCSYYCRIDERAGRYALVATRYRDHDEFVAGSLRELLEYVLAHHWSSDALRD